jgi:hypothetical protein
MKIAIDARKWRDYGIGTYVRNVVRHLAQIDRETTYLLFCNPADESALRDLAENFVPVVDTSPGYRVREHISLPLKLRRYGAELLHSPHYVRPLFCTIPSVVTIHDCIHLLFPQYLPNRMAFRYARYVMGSAIRNSSIVFTVSEASRADILRFYPSTDPAKVHVVPNAIDAELLVDPGEAERDRVRERYQIRGRFVLFAGNVKPHKNLERLIRAFARVRCQEGQRGPAARADRRRRQPLCLAAPHGRGGRSQAGRPLLRLRAARDAGGALPDGHGVRVSLALRGLRAAAARGDGVRDAGRHLAHLVLARGGRRRRPARRSLQRGRHRAGGSRACSTTRTCAHGWSSAGLERAAGYSWTRSVRQIHAGYLKALGRPVPATAEATS